MTVNVTNFWVLKNLLKHFKTQPRSQGFSLKKWVGRHPFFEGKALGTRLFKTLKLAYI